MIIRQIILVFFLLLSFTLEASPEVVENAIRDFHAGLTSSNEEENKNTIRKYMPTAVDLEFLFGEKGKLLANMFDESNTFQKLINDSGALAEKIRGKGKIVDIQLEPVLAGNPRYKAFFDEFELIPSDVEVYVPHIQYELLSGGPFHARIVLANKKVLFLVGFERFADTIRELDESHLTKKSKSLQPQKAVTFVGTAKKRQPLI